MQQTIKRFAASNEELLHLTQFTHKLFRWVMHNHGRPKDDQVHEELMKEYAQLYPLIKRTHYEPHSVVYDTFASSPRSDYFERLAQEYMSASRTKTLKPEDFAKVMGEFDELSQTRPPRIFFRMREQTIARQVIAQLDENKTHYMMTHVQRADPLIKSFLDRRHRMLTAMRKANANNPHYADFIWPQPVFEAFKRVVLAITYEKEAMLGDRSFLEKWFLLNNNSEKVELEQRTEGAMEELKTALASHPEFSKPDYAIPRLDFIWTMEKTIEGERARPSQSVRPPSWQEKSAPPAVQTSQNARN